MLTMMCKTMRKNKQTDDNIKLTAISMTMLILNSIVMQQFDKLIFVRLKIKKAQWLLSVKKFNKYRKKPGNFN